MRLTVLGRYGPYPPAGGACSGYLVEDSGCKILLDCGNGVLSRLQQQVPFWELDAIFLSHLHADHMSDLIIMRYGLEMAMKENIMDVPLPLYATSEPATEYEKFLYKNCFDLIPLYAGSVVEIKPFIIKAQQVKHSIPTLGFRLETEAETLVYSSDTEYHEELSQFACGADIFLCEANYQEKDLQNSYGNHMTASQAGRIAFNAGVKRLLLTHLHPNNEIKTSMAEAGKYYKGVEVASEGQTYLLDKKAVG